MDGFVVAVHIGRRISEVVNGVVRTRVEEAMDGRFEMEGWKKRRLM